MKRLLTLSLLTTTLFAQDFERVKPKEPTEFQGEQGITYPSTEDSHQVTNGNALILPELKGVVLTDKRRHLTEEETARAIGGAEAINIQVPGTIKHFDAMLKNNFLARPLTKQKLVDLKQEVIQYYRRWGRPVVSVEIPEQKVTNGVLEILVIEGKLGKVTVEGNKYFKDQTLIDYIRLEERGAIDSNILVTDLSWINRNPFRQVDIIYEPGELAGTTNIRLLTQDRRPYRFYAGVDNTGYDETENTRIFVGANWGNAFGLDHILSIQLTSAPKIDRFWAITGQYTIPLPWRDIWTFYGGYSHVHGDMQTDHPGLDNSGYSAQASTRYSWILTPRLGYLHDAIFGFDYKRTDNNLEFGGESVYRHSVNLTQLVAGYNGAYICQDFSASLTAELFYSPGPWLGEQSDSDYRDVRFQAKSSYFYGRMTFVPIIHLPKDFSFAMTFRGQVSSQNLLPSEQAGLGGYDSVRGYKEREVNVDNAFLASAEIRSTPLTFIGRKAFKDMLQFLVFLDYAIGRDVRTENHTPKTHYLLGTGPGVRYEIAPYLTFRGDLGFQLKKLDSRGFRFHFSLVGSY
ncbi:MAG: ShlB/FhaC/HecB family hemolysin secretion/activation protein [Simkaniaceae bacterium]|nr:MAG: ShlB/FhaC/HecB family hemolysin secretion/activation protein [Simkaniaceae bacterium]